MEGSELEGRSPIDWTGSLKRIHEASVPNDDANGKEIDSLSDRVITL